MNDQNNWYQPESQDAMEAVDAVIEGGQKKKKKSFFEQNMFPLKGDSKKERARKIIFDLLVLVMIGATCVLVWWFGIDPWMHNRSQGALGNLQTIVYICRDCGEDLRQEAHGWVCDTCIAELPPREPGQAPQAVTSPPLIIRRLDWDELFAINDQVVAWLNAPGANIDLPVVQTGDNVFYLYRDLWLRPSRYGNPFLDFRNRLRTTPHSTNQIVYGHHMHDGTIFSQLPRYRNVETVRRHPIITLSLPDGQEWHYIIFSVLTINGHPDQDNGYVFAVNTPDFPSQESFDGYLRQLRERSFVDVDIDVRWGDHLITLQTCVYEFPSQFLYVIGRRVRPGESLTVNANQITRNPNPRLPQALYDRQGRENPFRNAERWFPG